MVLGLSFNFDNGSSQFNFALRVERASLATWVGNEVVFNAAGSNAGGSLPG